MDTCIGIRQIRIWQYGILQNNMIHGYVLLFLNIKKYNATRKQRRPSPSSLGHLPWGCYTWMHSRAASPSMHSRSGLSQAPTRLCPLSLSPALPPLHRCIPGAASPAPPPQPLSLLCRPLSLSPALPPQPVPCTAKQEGKKGRGRGTFLDRR
jgi:hypothetical protein